MKLRKVKTFKWKHNPETTKLEQVFDRVGIFHMFLQDSNEDGPFPVAIVEFPDGMIENIPSESIQFLKPLDQDAID